MVKWSYYNKFDDILDAYLPTRGEGETKASQLVTAVNKLIYKWYNDGDVYDNTGNLVGWANDLSDYANWIYKYFPRLRKLLDEIFECETDSDYEDLLKDLADTVLSVPYLDPLKELPTVGSIYNCSGPYEFVDREAEDSEYDETEYDDEEDSEYDDIESSTSISSASGTSDDNEELHSLLDSLQDDFDYIIDGFDKLDRSGPQNSQKALGLAKELNVAIQEIISRIGKNIASE